MIVIIVVDLGHQSVNVFIIIQRIQSLSRPGKNNIIETILYDTVIRCNSVIILYIFYEQAAN